jgi:hypothetical protein
MAIEKNDETEVHNMSNANADQGNKNIPPTTNQIPPYRLPNPKCPRPPEPLAKKNC